MGYINISARGFLKGGNAGEPALKAGSSVGRALALQAGGHGFESRPAYHCIIIYYGRLER